MKRLRGIIFYTQLLLACKGFKKVVDGITTTNQIERLRTFQSHYKPWILSFLKKRGVTVCSSGLDLIPKDQPCIYMLTHSSFLDGICTHILFPMPHMIIVKEEPSRIWWLGDIYKFAAILLKRKNMKSMAKTMIDAKNAYKAGISIVVCPEGTRNDQKRMPVYEFPDNAGLFKFAHQMNIPVVIGTLVNAKNVLPKDMTFTPGIVKMVLTEVLLPQDSANYTALKDKVRERMIHAVQNN